MRLELLEAGAQGVITHLCSLTKIPLTIREAAIAALKNLSLPISGNVTQMQSMLDSAMEGEGITIDDTGSDEYMMEDHTPIIPLPGQDMHNFYNFVNNQHLQQQQQFHHSQPFTAAHHRILIMEGFYDCFDLNRIVTSFT